MSNLKREAIEGVLSDIEWIVHATRYPALIELKTIALEDIHRNLSLHLPKLRAMYEEWCQYDDLRNS